MGDCHCLKNAPRNENAKSMRRFDNPGSFTNPPGVDSSPSLPTGARILRLAQIVIKTPEVARGRLETLQQAIAALGWAYRETEIHCPVLAPAKNSKSPADPDAGHSLPGNRSSVMKNHYCPGVPSMAQGHRSPQLCRHFMYLHRIGDYCPQRSITHCLGSEPEQPQVLDWD